MSSVASCHWHIRLITNFQAFCQFQSFFICYLVVPDAPGIGIELVDNITELFPPAQRSINCQIAFDGSVRDV